MDPTRARACRCASEGACRLLAIGVDIRIIQLMLGHASIQQTQRCLNVTDKELRRGLEVRTLVRLAKWLRGLATSYTDCAVRRGRVTGQRVLL